MTTSISYKEIESDLRYLEDNLNGSVPGISAEITRLLGELKEIPSTNPTLWESYRTVTTDKVCRFVATHAEASSAFGTKYQDEASRIQRCYRWMNEPRTAKSNRIFTDLLGATLGGVASNKAYRALLGSRLATSTLGRSAGGAITMAVAAAAAYVADKCTSQGADQTAEEESLPTSPSKSISTGNE